MTIGEKIAKRRRELGMTQEELAEKIGVRGKSSVCRIETSGDNLTVTTLRKYAKALGLSATSLLNEEYSGKPVIIKQMFNEDEYVEVTIKGQVREETVIPVKVVYKEN